MTKRLGRSAFAFATPPCIRSNACVAGKKEGEGPLGNSFDIVNSDTSFGEKSWEKAESRMQELVLAKALSKASLSPPDIDMIFAGDLLNQCIGSAFALKDSQIPFFGLYGACSTCAEGLLLASIAVTHGVFDHCAAVTSSHYCAAERQYRSPIEYGGQRPPTAQWTVTGSGAFILGSVTHADARACAVIRRGMPGRVIEKGIRDANNMGAAMAPAAEDTLVRFFRATATKPSDYDLIVTGDLGYEGGEILCELMRLSGYDLADRYSDCGTRIYFREDQDVHGGGSGCGCSAVVLSAELLPKLLDGTWGRILFLSTGAMMSPDSIKQGQSIPAVAHLLQIERSGAGHSDPDRVGASAPQAYKKGV